MVTRWIERIDYDGAGGTVAITFHTNVGDGTILRVWSIGGVF
jgi:hypothetical protein